ncbi:MAG: SOS response-associated peptidase [Granulosicoccus sp.]|nr:SOS response-associated peptidase [Granulosicoccus sp.]
MCGRVNVSDNEGVRELLRYMGMDTWPSREPRFNIAPTQTLDVVALDGEELSVVPMSWGVSISVPGKKGMVSKRVQNARNDKVWTSRMWKPLIHSHRVLVPVNGFYEWRRNKGKLESAYYITASDLPALCFGGIFRQAKNDSEKPELAIITTDANKSMSPIHDRMPVMLGSANAAMAWLQDDEKDNLNTLMQSSDDLALSFTEVSSYVNKSSNEGPKCIEPLAA